MDPDRIVRFYVSFPLDPAAPSDRISLVRRLQEFARRGCGDGETPEEPEVIATISDLVRPPATLSLGLAPERKVVAFRATARGAERFVRQLGLGGADITAGIDLPLAPQSWWCPGQGPRYFGDRAAAERLIQAETLRNRCCGGKVNLVIVDQGLPAQFPFKGDRDGWSVEDELTHAVRGPFEGTGRHAAMVARNALAFVDENNVKLWDCPLLPERIEKLDTFLSYAQTAFEQIRDKIENYRKQVPDGGPWVMVNAWGVWDTSQDFPANSALNYSSNIDHALNKVVAELDDKRIDQVFAAGNCGQFCPSTRCGVLDRGPGRSIQGANSHPRVLSIGAVRADGLWVGYSAEGPGRLRVNGQAAEKPDLCAPTLFRDELRPFDGEDNSGTSAACGVAAGVVAAARSCTSWDKLTPEELRTKLRENAVSQGDDPTSRSRFGHGILNANF